MKGYFEGWYYKIVDQTENHILAIIPGISFDSNGESQAFVQFFDGVSAEMNYIPYRGSAFEFSTQDFFVRVGKNEFSKDKLALDIDTDGLKINGQITSSNHIPWEASVFEGYSCMGWYRYVPRMECYHGIISFDHTLAGSLEINDQTIDFTDGRGYMEKDYGTSFPKYYLWCQSNHFDTTKTSIMLSFAKIPWFFSYFDGFLAGLVVNGELFKFTTYTGAKVTKLELDDHEITVHIQDKRYKLEVIATKNTAVELASPIEGSMTGRILESITAQLDVKLIGKADNRIIFDGIGRHAGLDIGGQVSEIPRI